MFRKWILSVAVILVTVWATTQAQEPDAASGGLTLEQQADQYKSTVLLVLANRATSLPAENAFAVAAVLDEASQQLDACAAGLATHQQIWQYKVCGSAVLQQGLAALSALQSASGAAPSGTF
uniref:Protein TsetseEP domain-containing protein n=1 Tax=Anopheles maculatus TaxID=74869 RepID=A0A182SP33_9DIPT